MAATLPNNRGDREFQKFVLDGDDNVAIRTTATFSGTIGEVTVASEFAEDAAHTTGDKGLQILAVRNDAGTSLVGADGDYSPLTVNPNANLNINLENIRDAQPDIGLGAAGGGTLRVSQSTATGLVLAADGQVKASAGTVFAVHLSFVGVTAGDKIEIKNSADGSGTSLITLVAPVAAGSIDFCPCTGIIYSTAIYMDETKSGGTFTATIVYA